MNTRPFGNPAIDDWLHWRVVKEQDEVAVRYQRTWYIIGHTLHGYLVGKVKKGKASKKYEDLPPVSYADLPWQLQADLDQWRGKLIREISGLSKYMED